MSEVKVDTISERTTDAGVTIEGVKVEDGVATFQTAAGSPLVFEGATADAFETTFAFTDPTADRTITFPDASITLSAAGGFHQMVVKTASDATYSPATDVTKIVIEAVGGGGGSSNTGGSKGVTGAAGGGYARVSLAVTSATVINIQIGIAGPGGSGSEGPGTDGGNTTVTYVSGGSSFTTITCNGGEKGTIASGVQPTTDGGTATGPAGGLYITGESGAAWFGNDMNQWGGGNPLGVGGRPLSTGDPRAQSGFGYGAGASGSNVGTGIGRPGTAGVVIISEYK